MKKGGDAMDEIAIIDKAVTAKEVKTSCCGSDIWLVMIPDAEGLD